MLARRVMINHIPYDTSVAEITQLVSKFAAVDRVKMPRQRDGLAKGYAFVYLKEAKDVSSVIEYVDGRHIRGMQVQ